MEGIGEVIFVIFFFGFFALMIAGFVFWIIKLVEVARIPDHQYRAAGTEKLAWVLVVALAQAIGAIVWHFAKRREVLDATGVVPRPGPGWYPEPGTQGLRWWDGATWTEHRHGPP